MTGKPQTKPDEKLIHEAVTLLAQRDVTWKDLLVDVDGKNGRERWEVRCTKKL